MPWTGKITDCSSSAHLFKSYNLKQVPWGRLASKWLSAILDSKHYFSSSWLSSHYFLCEPEPAKNSAKKNCYCYHPTYSSSRKKIFSLLVFLHFLRQNFLCNYITCPEIKSFMVQVISLCGMVGLRHFLLSSWSLEIISERFF